MRKAPEEAAEEMAAVEDFAQPEEIADETETDPESTPAKAE